MGESAHTEKLARDIHAQLEVRADPRCQTKISKVVLTKTEISGVRVQAILALAKKLSGCHCLLEIGVFVPLLDRAFARRCREAVPFALLQVATRRRCLADLESHMIERALGETPKSNPDAVIHFLTERMRKVSPRVASECWEKLDASVRNTSLAGAT